jgi:uncharacterized membrane protein YeiH
MQLIYWIDLFGVFVFAISGINVGLQRKLDVFGASVIAFATAIGGGTIRDLLLGSTPVGWMKDANYIYAIVLGVVLSLFFRPKVQKLSNTIFLFDTIGLALYSIIGIKKALMYDMSPVVAIMLGTVSAVFGGVLRDVLTNQIPLIFRKEIYAILSILGGGLYFLIVYIYGNETLSMYISMVFIIVLRLVVVKKKWELPKL